MKQDKSKARKLSSKSKNKSDYIIKWRLLNDFSRYQRKKCIHVQKTKIFRKKPHSLHYEKL